MLRDPVDRIWSGFRNWCNTDSNDYKSTEKWHCVNFETATKVTFEAFVLELHRRRNHDTNDHFKLQSSFCGGLAHDLCAYTHVLTLSDPRFAEQLKRVLVSARAPEHAYALYLARAGGHRRRKADRPGAIEPVTLAMIHDLYAADYALLARVSNSTLAAEGCPPP